MKHPSSLIRLMKSVMRTGLGARDGGFATFLTDSLRHIILILFLL